MMVVQLSFSAVIRLIYAAMATVSWKLAKDLLYPLIIDEIIWIKNMSAISLHCLSSITVRKFLYVGAWLAHNHFFIIVLKLLMATYMNDFQTQNTLISTWWSNLIKLPDIFGIKHGRWLWLECNDWNDCFGCLTFSHCNII